MSTKRLQLDHYRKSLLNRVTSSNAITQYIENCLAREDEAAKHSFHKVMVHNWSGTVNQLFDTLSEYFSSTIIPVMYLSKADITSFYTSSLSIILKMIKLDFMFPFQRNMFNIDILFNDKNSVECFDNSITMEDIVCGVVSGRMNENFELDLSNFCCDPEFIEKKICFYKINLLSHFKILMLRMGRDTRLLNLSNNDLSHNLIGTIQKFDELLMLGTSLRWELFGADKLKEEDQKQLTISQLSSQVPMDILNFFIKGNLTSINLSNNNIPSIAEVLRVSSRIEKLWIEGNPLCDELDPTDYVKSVTMKFPRLRELDGINLNQNGLTLPYFKNFLVTPDRRTKMVTEKFLTLYFSNYDCRRKKLFTFYDAHASFTLVATFNEAEENLMPVYANHSRNILEPNKTNLKKNNRVYWMRESVVGALNSLPNSIHDPTTFSVDVLHHDKKSMILVVDGIFKELNNSLHLPDRIFQFRRTFVFNIVIVRQISTYLIKNEIFSLSLATEEQAKNSFTGHIRNMNELSLTEPDTEDMEAVIKAFIHITQLKRHEAETRLKFMDWDLRKALHLFMGEMKQDKISKDKFIEDDDFSDTSSLMDDEID